MGQYKTFKMTDFKPNVRAAYATGADVLVIDETDPGCPADGVAGLLRFA